MSISFKGSYVMKVPNPSQYAAIIANKDNGIIATPGKFLVQTPTTYGSNGIAEGNVLVLNGQDAKDYAEMIKVNMDIISPWTMENKLNRAYAAKALYMNINPEDTKIWNK